MKKMKLLLGIITAFIAATLQAEIKSSLNYVLSPAKIINICELGAIGDGNSHTLNTITELNSQTKIDTFYGVGSGYTTDDELDYVSFCEALKIAKGAGINIGGNSYQNAQIYIPNGNFTFNRKVDIKNLYGLTIAGAGRCSTVIIYKNCSDDLFYIESAGFICFRDFSVYSQVSDNSTIFHFNNVQTTFKFKFDSIEINRAYRCFYTTGNAMCSEMTFVNCRMIQSLIGLNLNNNQSLNFHLFGCDFEAYGTDSIYSPYTKKDTVYILAEAGGMVNVVGGSVIHGGRTLYLNPRSGYIINFGNNMYNFTGVRWEQEAQDVPFLFDAGSNAFRGIVNFNECMVHQIIAVQNGMLGRLTDGVDVAINNCSFNYGYFMGEIDDLTASHQGSLSVSNTKYFIYQEHRNNPALTNLHHNVHYRASGYRQTDNNYRIIPQGQLMSFDITANQMSAVSPKRLVLPITQVPGTVYYLFYMPDFATLSSVGLAATSNNGANITVSATNYAKTTTWGQTIIAPNTQKGFIDHMEIKDGINGKFYVKIQSTEASLTGNIICEYY